MDPVEPRIERPRGVWVKGYFQNSLTMK